jgi:hypothetical protein
VPLQEPGYIAQYQSVAETDSNDNGSRSIYHPTLGPRSNANSFSVPDVETHYAPLLHTELQQTRISTRGSAFYTDREEFDVRMSFGALLFLKGVI